MATLAEVLDSMITMSEANLSYPPKDIDATAKVWARLLADVPGPALIQATDDLILTAREFPKLSDIRTAARQVQVHNGTSAAPSPWKDTSRGRTMYVAGMPVEVIEDPNCKGIMAVGADGWAYWQPGMVDIAVIPGDAARRIAEIEDALTRDNRLMTDAEIAEIDALMEAGR